MPPTIETDLREIFAKFDQRFDRLEQRLDGLQKDLADLKTSQQKDMTDVKLSQAEIRGDIQTLDEKVSGFGKRLENQEFVNRSVFAAILVTILAGAVRFLGFFPNP
ncbi:MAG: hypothetical protein GC158_02300 [Cyanobacteria bacterium RI_101]|nr:hypothetical protein [Cyanobacteria bacterium RI_101]